MQETLKFRYILLITLLIFGSILKESISQVFVKITDQTNPVVTATNWGGYYKGCSWVDVDNDNLLDLYFPGSQIFKNLGNGNFSVIQNSLPLDQGMVIGNSWADYDNDGNIDLFLVGSIQVNPRSALYKNNGQGVFTKIMAAPFLDSAANSGWGCSWGDINNDGYPDLMISAAYGFGGVLHVNRLFLNNGNGSFTRIDTTNITAATGPYTVPVFSDFDQDGDIDLFIGSGPASGTPARDFLYKNLRNEVAAPFFFSRINTGILGTDLVDGQNWNWIDYDNDGDLDGFLTNYSANIPNNLYRCDGPGVYTKMTQADVGDIVSYHPGSSLGNTWGDFDNDGNIDCLITNDGGTKCFYYKNNGNGTFSRKDSIALTFGSGPHIGATAGDYNNDGFLDLYLTGNGAQGLFNNITQNGNNWVNIKFVGSGPPTGSNKSALGTIIKAKATINGVPKWQMREINAQNGFNSMNALNVHFGFGNATVIDSIIVKWPRGLTQVFTNIAADKFYQCIEGQDFTQILIGINQISSEVPSAYRLYQNYPNPFNPSTKIKFDIPSAGQRHAFDVHLIIYDITGREVAVLLNKQLTPGTYETNWNADKFSSGVYFFRITAGEFTDTKKLILIK